jgi:hypothetical protein
MEEKIMKRGTRKRQKDVKMARNIQEIYKITGKTNLKGTRIEARCVRSHC